MPWIFRQLYRCLKCASLLIVVKQRMRLLLQPFFRYGSFGRVVIILSFSLITSQILPAVSLSWNCSSGHTSHSMVDFSILKYFRVNGHVNKAPKIIQVTWYPPLQGWIKCNTDGACRGSSGLAACGGIFRNSLGLIIGFLPSL